ncbi:MAG: hypothetical protein RQ982_08070 [Gammaproteobacteria bacterium]|nr:hypothetical protein [Gammaproteobacteria bacterium]
MTGTVSELSGNDNKINPGTYGLELFTSWLFGKINARCILLDINQEGCKILIPVSKSMPAAEFKLIIMSPDDAEKVHTIVSAQPNSSDSYFSLTHKKINCRLVGLDEDLRGEIKLLETYLSDSDEKNIKCSILKH